MAKAKRMETLVINQSNWLTGDVLKYSRRHCENVLNSSLRDEVTGLQCCLGFACVAAGVVPERMVGAALPNDLDPAMFNSDDTYALLTCIEDDASEINDNRDLTITKRKALLRKVFKRIDVALKFTGSIAVAKRKVAKAYSAGKL